MRPYLIIVISLTNVVQNSAQKYHFDIPTELPKPQALLRVDLVHLVINGIHLSNQETITP